MEPKTQTDSRTDKEKHFTGGKLPEFAVYYNMAAIRMVGLFNSLTGQNMAVSLYDYEQEGNFKEAIEHLDGLPEAVLFKLKQYLWKGYLLDKNTSGQVLTVKDKQLMKGILTKLNDIRNFHSHVWHDNTVLEFDKELREFVEEMHIAACMAQGEEMAGAMNMYLNRFHDSRIEPAPHVQQGMKQETFFNKLDDGRYMMTQEGRTFFLSFFLTRGEMARFLQQRKGSKRNDRPEFKVKHLIYCHYCHRDGAARYHYGQEENVLDGMANDEKKKIMAMRQTFKILQYLNDVPDTINDPKLFPLFLNDASKAETALQLAQWCLHNGKLNGIAIKDQARTMVRPALGKAVNRTEKKSAYTAELRHSAHRGLVFEMGAPTLHRILLDTIRKTTEADSTKGIEAYDGEQWLQDKLNAFAMERKRILELLASWNRYEADENDSGKLTLTDELDQYYRFRLRSDEGIRRLMGAWLDKMDKGYRGDKERGTLAEYLKKEPITLTHHDFSYTEEEKQRASDRFTAIAVQFLMEHGKTPQWLWMTEKFETVEKSVSEVKLGKMVTETRAVQTRVLNYRETLPDDERLAVTDNHVLVVHASRPDVRFLLGHRALKNLLIRVVGPAHKADVAPLLERLIADLDTITDAMTHGQTLESCDLKVLTRNEIPEAMLSKLDKGMPLDQRKHALVAAAEKRIEHILKELEPFVETKEGPIRMKRADKNRQIMRCYRYFEWQYPQDSQFKFLRKDEYKRMSVYHYLLKSPISGEKGSTKKSKKYDFLITDIGPHMPQEVKEMLKKATDLDDLLRLVASATTELLELWKAQLPHLKTKRLHELLGRIGVPTHSTGWEKKAHVPFAIHPILPVRAFHKGTESLDNVNLSKALRETAEREGLLRMENYNYRGYLQHHCPADAQRSMKKIIGVCNALITEDALLHKMAEAYLHQTEPAYQNLFAHSDNRLKVQGYRNSALQLKCDFDSGKPLYVAIQFHQLDDYLLVESKHIIGLAAKQVLLRHYTPEQQEQLGISKHRNGNWIIPYTEVFKEIQRVQNDSVRWAEAIFIMEAALLDGVNLATKESVGSRANPSGHERISFSEVMKLGNVPEDISKRLGDIRNTAFHGKIPSGWSYAQKAIDPEVSRWLRPVKKEWKKEAATRQSNKR